MPLFHYTALTSCCFRANDLYF